MDELKEIALERLDEIEIPSEADPARVALRVGLICTLHVQGNASQDTRKALANCGEDYLRRFGDKIKMYLPPDGYTPYRGYQADPGFLSEYVEKNADLGVPFTPSFTGSGNIDNASSYSLELVSTRTLSGKVLCSFSATLPFSYVLERPNEAAFQAIVSKWSGILRPYSGYAGVGVLQSVDYDERLRTSAQAYALGIRFRGLDVDNPTIIALYIDRHIKGVNWLTVLSDECLAGVGGRMALVDYLGNSKRLIDFDGGIIVQAGEVPQIGDANRRHVPREYKRISDFLRPIRMRFPDGRSFIRGVPGRNNTEVSNDWLSRFD